MSKDLKFPKLPRGGILVSSDVRYSVDGKVHKTEKRAYSKQDMTEFATATWELNQEPRVPPEDNAIVYRRLTLDTRVTKVPVLAYTVFYNWITATELAVSLGEGAQELEQVEGSQKWHFVHSNIDVPHHINSGHGFTSDSRPERTEHGLLVSYVPGLPYMGVVIKYDVYKAGLKMTQVPPELAFKIHHIKVSPSVDPTSDTWTHVVETSIREYFGEYAGPTLKLPPALSPLGGDF